MPGVGNTKLDSPNRLPIGCKNVTYLSLINSATPITGLIRAVAI